MNSLIDLDFGRSFILSTDVSMDGVGAVLSQVGMGDTNRFPFDLIPSTFNISIIDIGMILLLNIFV